MPLETVNLGIDDVRSENSAPVGEFTAKEFRPRAGKDLSNIYYDEVRLADGLGESTMTRLASAVISLLLGATAPSTVAAANCKRWNTDTFFRAATAADVQKCLNAGKNPNARGKSKRTPLHLAARDSDSASVVLALIEGRASVNATDAFGQTPLHYAAFNAEGVVRVLLEAGANANAKQVEGASPLHFAATRNHSEGVVRALLEAGADPTATDADGWTPLLLATRYSDRDAQQSEAEGVVRALVEAGADVNAREDNRGTPLLFATRYGKSARVVHVLLEAGADPNARTDGGTDVVDGWTPLHYAAYYSESASAIRELIQAGADPSARAIDGTTPLHNAACCNGSAQVIQALIGAGPDVNARDSDGWTPLHYAARYSDSLSVVQALVEAGADVNAREEDGWTPLHLVARYGKSASVVHALVEAGADPNARTLRGRLKPLDLAALGAGRVRKALRVAGANWKREKQGSSVLAALAVGAVAGTAAGAGGLDAAQSIEAAAAAAEPVLTGQPPAVPGTASSGSPPGSSAAAQGVGECEIPGFPKPANIRELGLPWCPASVGFQLRALALQAAGLQCGASLAGSPDKYKSQIAEVCKRLDAVAANSTGPSCRCPVGML